MAVLAISALWSPEAMAAGAPLELLGIPRVPCAGCGACGLSRAFAAFTRLEFSDAVAFNPSVLLLYPLTLALAFGGPVLSLRLFRGRPCSSRHSSS